MINNHLEQTEMKTNKIFVLIVLVGVILFSSCKQKTVKTLEKSFSERYFLSDDTTKGVFNMDIRFEIPVCYHNSKTLDSIRNRIITELFGASYIALHNDSVAAKFAVDMKTEYIRENKPMLQLLDKDNQYSIINEHLIEGFSLLSDEKIYSYGINRFVFMGGAHGLNTYSYFIFDLKSGGRLKESDLFVKGFETKMTELLKAKLLEQIINDKAITPNTGDLVVELIDTDFWVDSIKPNNNFYITEESVNYVFNAYEIGPYYLGMSEIIIPFADLKALIKPESIIDHIVNKKDEE